jgi:hypothetical protein
MLQHLFHKKCATETVFFRALRCMRGASIVATIDDVNASTRAAPWNFSNEMQSHRALARDARGSLIASCSAMRVGKKFSTFCAAITLFRRHQRRFERLVARFLQSLKGAERQ